MKKLFSLFLALLLIWSIPVPVLAASVPSKTTQDMTKVNEIRLENAPEGAAPTLTIVTQPAAENAEQTPEYKEKLETCSKELEKLAASDSVAAYFGEIKNPEGNAVDLATLLGVTEGQDIKVHEFLPIEVSGYDPAYGAMTIQVAVSQSYEKGEKVIVLIGIQKIHGDGTVTVDWTAVECIADDGIEMTLTPELLVAIQGGTAMMSVVSHADSQ